MSYGVFTELEKLKKKQQEKNQTNTGRKTTLTPVIEDTGYGVFDELRKLEELETERSSFKSTTKKDDSVKSKEDDDEDIAPVKEKEEEEDTWFRKGALADGISLKNIGKAILGTGQDVSENLLTGIVGLGEKVVDSLAYVAPYLAQGQYYQNGGGFSIEQQKVFDESIAASKEFSKEFIEKDLYDEEKVAKFLLKPTVANQLAGSESSVLGNKSDALVQSAGQLAGTAALSAVGVPWYLTTGVSSFGSEVESGLKQGATMEEAGLSGLVTAGAEILTEKISGGIKFGGKALDEGLTKEIARLVSDKTARTLLKVGFDAAGEGFEEVLSGAISAVGQKLTYADEKEFSEIFSTEDALDSFIGGAVLGGGFSGANAVKAKLQGTDFASEMTNNEKAVVDKEYKDRVAEKEKDGKISQTEKSKIYDQVVKDMEMGNISVETIEEVVGGESFKAYQDTVKSEDAKIKELEDQIKELEDAPNTVGNAKKYDALQNQLEELKNNSQRDQLKSKLSEDVKGIVFGELGGKGSRLAESYNEVARREQAFEADLNQYDDPNAKKTVENFMGVVNNTNKAHAVVDFLAKISKDTGQVFKAADAKKFGDTALAIKRTKTLEADGTTTEFNIGSTDISTEFKPVVTVDSKVVDNYTVDYKTGKITFDTAPTGKVNVEFRKNAIVNGNIANGEITVDIRSKKYLESIVGHEVTHVLENTEFYKPMQEAIFEYAKAKGEYDSRLKKLQDLYNGVEGANVEAELTADLVGDYLFQDSDFISKLSTENRNVFQKVYDEIKHLLKLATAGSEQARKLEQVKYKFDQVYRELGKAEKNTADSGVKHSLDIKHTDGTVEKLADARSLTTEQAVEYMYQAKAGALRRDTYIPVRKDTPQVLIDTLEQVNERIENLSMVMGVEKAQGAMGVENPGARTKKYGDNVRKHGLSPEEVVEIINNLDNPTTVIYETNRYNKKGKRLPNSVAVFVEYKTNGNEGMAAVEFENPRSEDAIGTEFGETNYHTVITVFEPDTERNGMPFDYVEELLSDPNNYELEIKRRQADESATGEKHPNTSNELPSSAVKVAQEEPVVKGKFSLSDSSGRQLSSEQAEYFKDSKVRDENGSLKVMYHGTPNGDFTVFKDGTYFTDNKEYADRYQNPGASSISTGKTASNPKTFEVYLDIKKPFDLSDAEAKRIYIEDYIKGGNAMGTNPYLSDAEYEKINTIDWTEGEDLREFLVENGYDYDGLVLDEGADGGYGDAVQSRGKSYVVFSPEQVKNVDNAKPTADPDIRFSLSETVEETKDLIAVHNLRGTELVKSLELGGLPMPSVAIIKDQASHDKYGDVSLIFPKEAIDPKANRANKVYGGDAWTPTYPKIEYKPNKSVEKRIREKYYDLSGRIGYEETTKMSRYVNELEDVLNRAGGEAALLEDLYNDRGMMQIYLQDIGKGKVEDVNKEIRTEMSDAEVEMHEFFIKELGADVVDNIKGDGTESPVLHRRRYWEEHGGKIKDAYEKLLREEYGFTDDGIDNVLASTKTSDYLRFIHLAHSYRTNGRVTIKAEKDYEATKAAIIQAAGDGYKAWIDELFAGVEEKTGIRNNKDYFDGNGNRRSWDALHWENTLENVVKTMKSQKQTGADAMFAAQQIDAVSAKEYGSIADIKADSHRLQTIPEEQYEEIKDSYQQRFSEIAGRIMDKNISNPYTAKEIAMESVVDAIRAAKTPSGILSYLKRNSSVTATAKDVADIISLVNDIANMPTGYFEAKPQRAVGFDEVAVFVIPYDADVKLKQELLNRGYSIAEYDPKVEGDRQRVMNQFEEYKFSLADATDAPKRYGDRATLGSEIAYTPQEMEEDIAPVAETQLAEENSTVAENATAQDLFPDDTAAMQEEYEFLMAEYDDLKGAIDTFTAVGDTARAEELMPEYEAVQAKIAQIESDDADRFASIDEADAPVEIDNAPEDVADNVPLTKTLVADLAKQVRSQLGLPAKRVAEVRELIEQYSAEEFPSKAHLYTEIQERFGKYTEKYTDEDLKGIKSLLRKSGISVDETIKRDIADYGQLMKSNFGKVRFSNQGLPVDVAYMEFNDVLPGLFPERIDVPADQLLRIIEVANMDTTIEQEYDIDSETLVEITELIANSVNQFKQNRKETLANKFGRESFNSLMESADQYVPPVKLNTSAPTRAEMTAQPDDIAPVFDTATGQQALMPEPEQEAEAPKRLTRKELHERIVDDITTTFREKGYEFTDVLKNAKDLSTFATVDNTPQRVMEKALGYKQGQVLADLTVNKVAQNETQGIRWLNSFTDKKTGLLAKISKQYGIKPGSKASAAAQMYAEGFYVGENDAIIEYGDKELAADFPDMKVRENIKKLARDPRIRQIYDETLAAINESRTRNAYPEIPRLDNYFLHFRAMEDTFSRLGLPFNPNDIRAKDLPTDLNGVTADLKPGQPYFASAMHRKGKRTSFDMLGGLEKYLTSAKNQIYHIDDIQTLRALRNYVAQTYGQAHGLENLDTMSNEEAEQRIEEVYNSHLSTFAKFLNEEANVLAGKTSLIDRGLEGVIGRRGITFLDTLNKQVGANMVGFNVSSSLTNFIAPVQAFAKSNKFDFVKAMAQTAANKIGSVFGNGDNFAQESPVIIRRKGAERFYRTPYEKVADKGYILMGMVDDISTELIARTKYNELTRKGMDSQQAHIETDKWVSRLMGDRSLGQQPQLYNSKMLGLFTKFQLEVRNQLDSQFYDTIQEAKVSTEQIENGLLRNAKKAAKITSTFAQLAVLQHLFGKAFESVAGYNPSFDIIEALIKTFGWDDEEDDEDTVLDNIEEGFLSLLGDLPYTSTLTGGRIPIASALPVTELIKGEDQYGNEKSRWDTLGEAAPYYLLPGGYGQVKKTMAGMKMFDDELPIAGSYTDSGNLRFPVEDTIGNRVQAGLFGQWASENARDYFDNERKPLNEKQTQELIATDMPIKEYWDYREELSKLDTLEEKVDYIAGLDLPLTAKNILANNATDRKEPINLASYDEYSSLDEMDFAIKNPEKYEVAQAIGGYAAYRGYKEGMKDLTLAEKADYIAGLDLTVEQKNIFINSETDRKEPIDLTGYENYSSFEEFEYAKKNPESYALAKSVGGYDSYLEYNDALGDIKSDKDEWGESISGSRKPKVYSYIYSLPISDVEKHILFKSEYPSTDDYNYEIIEYLNERDDISYDEMVAILQKLDFKVSSDGTIRW